MTQAPDGYTVIDTLRADEQFVLLRAARDADRLPVLLLAAHGAAPHATALLEHEYALREVLDGAWAATPLALLHGHASATLVLADSGGAPLELSATPLDLPDFLAQAAAITLAVSYSHHSRLVHRDLAAHHILFDPATAGVRLTGFGMATPLNGPDDPQADLVRLGLILYHMLCGAAAQAGGDGAPEPLAPHRRRPGVDRICSSIVARLLAADPAQRYQSAAGLYADLQHCRSMLEAQGRVEPFVLGCHDGALRVRIPAALVGRAPQLALLDESLRHAAAGGAPQLVLVSGRAGTGKSALVAALRRSDAAQGATIIAGKFDQRQRDIPYATLAQAFQGLVRERLREEPAVLAAWRAALREALGPNARLMLDLIPELALVIGEHASPPPLAPPEAQSRFDGVFRRFLQACRRPGTALLLCLDDVQWIDPASLKLLSHLLTHRGMDHMLAICAWRTREASGAHPMALPRDAMLANGAQVREVVLEALDRAEACELVAAALDCENAEAAPLAALVFPKTAGNPFFTLQFLTRLGENRLLRFNDSAACWEWDAQAIQAREFSDNVVELMVARLGQLPGCTLDLVKLLACLGPDCGLDTIALVSGMSLLETDEYLWPAARLGLIVREPGNYRFAHDRVQEGAYSMIAASSLPERHLHIGRLLLENVAPGSLDKHVFDIVHHLNRARAAMRDTAELRELARLNALAGTRARNAIAYDSARNYFSLAAALTPARAWKDDLDGTYAMYAALAECEYLCGHLERAGRLFELLVEQSRSRIDLARVALLRVAVYQLRERFDQAVAVALDALALFGVTFPATRAEIDWALREERAAIDARMAGRSIDSLRDEPASTDPEVAIVTELLSDIGSPVFAVRPELYFLLAAKALNYTLTHGSSESSCMIYSRYAILLVSLGAIEDAFAFSALAIEQVQFNAPPSKRSGRLRFVHAAYIHSWRDPIAASVAPLEQAFASCERAGDLPHAGYSAHVATWNAFEAGLPLADVRRMAEHYQGFARRHGNHALVRLLRGYEQLALTLMGEDGHGEDGAAGAIAVIGQGSFGASRARYLLMQQVLAFAFGRYEEALAASEAAAANLHFFLASLNETTHHFYHALAMTAVYRTAPPARRRRLLEAVCDKHALLAGWAASCPVNFASRHLLVGAELARIDGNPSGAMRGYEDAIAAAMEGGFVQNAALACELAAACCRERGAAFDAIDYGRRALRAWDAWGAQAKVRDLLRRFPELAADA
ncbi:ATP-binding protein [Massilia pseudoviolaceinigra]|uniref:ATP-binding protein n=1 Tax=Massilia pseudoviolaceinigra TaxID=3057165 RepID=UPI0027969C8E|nr:AAA family ATPase [Massilia sp. CCM 9206]MDQ1920248.1 AAA family ATPase [Massilia sp. CCM 9206]